MASAVQQGAPRLGYLGTTASSRAKLSQDPPTNSSQEEEKENLSSSDLLLSAGLDLHGTKPDPLQDRTGRYHCSLLCFYSETKVQFDLKIFLLEGKKDL